MKKILRTFLVATVCTIFITAMTAFTGSANYLTANANLLSTPLGKIGLNLTGNAAGNGSQNSSPAQGTLDLTGLVKSVSPDQVTLTLGDGSDVVVQLGSAAQAQVSANGLGTTLSNLLTNQQVNILAHTGTNQSLIADNIQVVADASATPHRVGVVTDYQPGVSLTIADSTGQSSTFQLTADTRILPVDNTSQLGTGSHVTVMTNNSNNGAGPLTATGIVVHPANEVAPTSHLAAANESAATAEPTQAAATGGSGSSTSGGSTAATQSPWLSLGLQVNKPQNPLPLGAGLSLTIQ